MDVEGNCIGLKSCRLGIFLVNLGVRDTKSRYRPTFLGAIRIFLKPMLGAGTLISVFQPIAKVYARTVIFSWWRIRGA
jgi:ABC-type polysaccharide/polyol phosphate export permease